MKKFLILIAILSIPLLASSDRVYSIQLLSSSSLKEIEKRYELLPQEIKNRSIIYVTNSKKYTIRYLISKRATPLKITLKNLKVPGLRKDFWVVNTDYKKAKIEFFKKYQELVKKDKIAAKELKEILSSVYPDLDYAAVSKSVKKDEKRTEQKEVEKKEVEKKEKTIAKKKEKQKKIIRLKVEGKKRIDDKQKLFYPEPWMELSAALYEYDLQKVDKIISTYKGFLPHRDEVLALSRLKRVSDAKEGAFNYMQKYTYDYYLYKQFLDLVLQDSSRVIVDISTIDRTEAIYSDLKASLIKEITQKRYIGVATKNYFIGSFDEALYKNIPSTYETLELSYKQLHDRGYFLTRVGIKRYLELFPYLSFEYSYRLTDKLDTRFNASLAEDSKESVSLLLGGVKDKVGIDTTYNFNYLSSISLLFALERYKDQKQKEIATGSDAEINLFKKLRVAYPDFSFRGYLKRKNFSQANNSTNINSILVNPLEAAVVPFSYSEAGVGFLFGLEHQYRYTRRWRPFFDITIFYNSLTDRGYSALLGVGGPLFHKDNLSLSLRYGSDFEGTGQSYMESSFYYLYLF